MRLMKTMREQHNRPADIHDEIEADDSTSMCSAFMDTLTSMDLLILSDAVRDGDSDSEPLRQDAVGRRRAVRSR